MAGTISLKTRLYVYISHFLSAWGDRMWQFGIGLFLVELEPQSLQLVAIYGFVSGASTLLLSTVIGDWVDRTARLKAARISLVAQNVFVGVCAIVVFVVHYFFEEIKAEWEDEWLLNLCYFIIIALGILADLASVANTIVIERDWIVELCQRDEDLLSSMSSTLRTIDLTTKLLAPIVTGQVIYFLNIGYGGVFVAGWNSISVFLEYALIKKVYDQIPSLANQTFKNEDDDDDAADEKTPLLGNDTKDDTKIVEPTTDVTFNKSAEQNGNPVHIEIEHNNKIIEPNGKIPEQNGSVPSSEPKKKKKHSLCHTIFYSFIILFKGWKTFMSYQVAYAGLGLATLYMTVLGFDNITVGYSYSQGISESLLGILMAVGSIFGIAGTFAYPFIRRRIGLKSTGLFGLLSQIVCLSACVVSVWLPGSPFDLLHRLNEDETNSSIAVNSTIEFSTMPMTTLFDNFTTTSAYVNVTTPGDPNDDPESYLSIGVFLGGLIVARFGLWIADLSITQLFLQSVKEKERGLVSGVQNSLNMLMDMLKALMVILAPYPEEFGLLTIISFSFVCMGCMLYIKFVCSNIGRSYR